MRKILYSLKCLLINLRFPFLVITDWEGKKYWTSSQYFDLPDGWRKCFGLKICKEIKKELKKTKNKEYHVTQIKEKFGSLRWYSNHTTESIEKIIEKYEKISARTCIYCGKETDYLTLGWIVPICMSCANKSGTIKIRKGEEIITLYDE